MEISFRLCLPRDASSIPAVRRLIGSTLGSLGVEDDCINDVEVAVTEACTNVLKHATGAGDQYEVEVDVDEEHVRISIIDTGHGFDHQSLTGDAVEDSEESGRGILIMRALVDRVEFKSEPQAGMIVHLTKALKLRPDSILGPLVAAKRRGESTDVAAASLISLDSDEVSSA